MGSSAASVGITPAEPISVGASRARHSEVCEHGTLPSWLWEKGTPFTIPPFLTLPLPLACLSRSLTVSPSLVVFGLGSGGFQCGVWDLSGVEVVVVWGGVVLSGLRGGAVILLVVVSIFLQKLSGRRILFFSTTVPSAFHVDFASLYVGNEEVAIASQR